MDEIDQYQVGGPDPDSPDSSKPPRKISRLLLLWPLAGLVTLVFAVVKYPPLDDTLVWWVGGIACFVVAALIDITWYYPDLRQFFPRTVWLAFGSLFVPLLLLVNGALDHSPIEQHRVTIRRTILERGGRGGGPYYYVECSSWRGRSDEKLMVSYRKYPESRPGDPFIVETRRGALGISLVVSVHSPE